MKKLLFILVSFPLLTFSQLMPAVAPRDSLFPFYQYSPVVPGLTAKALTTAEGNIGFYEFKPPGYQPDSSYAYPLIIFLHGVGERGNGTTELPLVLNASFPRMIANGATMNFRFGNKQSAFVVLMPQMSKQYINWQNFYTDAMIDYARQHLKIDTNRIFVCGWSLGGGGAWKYVTSSAENARRIAAVVVAAPAPDYVNLGLIAQEHVAVWAHHAKDDSFVPLHLTTDAVEEINSHAPDLRAMISYYPSGGHPFTGDAPFDTLNTYLYPNIYEWLNGTSRRNSLATNRPPVPNAGNDTTFTIPSRLSLNGTASYDPNDVIVKYNWKLRSGQASPQFIMQGADLPVATVSGLEPGEYTFRLTVADEFGAVRYDDVRVRVGLPPHGVNASPYVYAGRDTVVSTAHCTLRGFLKDFDGRLTNYRWRQIAGPATASIAQYEGWALVQRLTKEGRYLFELTGYDDHHPAGASRDTVSIRRVVSIPVNVLYRPGVPVHPDRETITRIGTIMMFVCFVFVPVYLFRSVSRNGRYHNPCRQYHSTLA